MDTYHSQSIFWPLSVHMCRPGMKSLLLSLLVDYDCNCHLHSQATAGNEDLANHNPPLAIAERLLPLLQ